MKQKLQAPVKMPDPGVVPWDSSDVPAVCWIRSNESNPPSLVTAISPTQGVLIAYYGWVPFACLAGGWQYSSDLKTWLPARK